MSVDNLDNMQEETDFDKEFAARDYICPVCGKEFHIPMYMSLESYVYVVNVYDKSKRRTTKRKCCSYACYRQGSA